MDAFLEVDQLLAQVLRSVLAADERIAIAKILFAQPILDGEPVLAEEILGGAVLLLRFLLFRAAGALFALHLNQGCRWVLQAIRVLLAGSVPVLQASDVR